MDTKKQYRTVAQNMTRIVGAGLMATTFLSPLLGAKRNAGFDEDCKRPKIGRAYVGFDEYNKHSQTGRAYTIPPEESTAKRSHYQRDSTTDPPANTTKTIQRRATFPGYPINEGFEKTTKAQKTKQWIQKKISDFREDLNNAVKQWKGVIRATVFGSAVCTIIKFALITIVAL